MKKKPNTCGWFSAYYRGLLPFLEASWLKIRAEVPDAELHVAYGWESWLAIQGENEFYVNMEKKFEEMKDHGVVVHGRLGHKDLVKLMQQTQVWTYPTEFPEIHCITALKTQEARCFPVTTSVAALDETVQSGVKIKTRRMYSDDYNQKKFVKEVVAALKEKKEGTPVPKSDWTDRAQDWQKAMA